NMMTKLFQSLGLKREMLEVVSQLYFKKPTPIQEEAIPEILLGNSIIGQSQTGSGKTHAYLLPLFEKIDATKQGVQLVLTAPTRELAIQIHEEVKNIIKKVDKKELW